MIVDPDMPDHWKTRMLGDLLGNEAVAICTLIRLWAHCQNRRKTEFDNLTPFALKAVCRFDGDPETLESALTECGFIERRNCTLIVVGWKEHNSKMAAAWSNGKRGGRPAKSVNPTETQQEPNGNPTGDSVNPQETGRKEGVGKKKNTCPSSADDGPADKTPLQEIVGLYHEHCPSLPRVLKLTPARQQAIRARWRNELTNLDDWRHYFTVVEQSDFLAGRSPPSGARSKPFIADFDFLTKQANVIKVMEGKYDD